MDNYWQQRALTRLVTAERTGQVAMKRALPLYDKALKNITDEINEVYRLYSQKTGLDVGEINQILTGGEKGEFVKKMRKKMQSLGMDVSDVYDKGYIRRLTRLEAIKQQVYWEIRKIAPEEVNIQESAYKEVIQESYRTTTADIRDSMGEKEGKVFAHLNDQAVNEIMQQKWVGGNYKTRSRNNNINLANEVMMVVGGGLAIGKSRTKMASELEETAEIGKYDAMRLIRTETNYIMNQTELKSYEDNGIEYYDYLAIMDNRTSDECEELNGTRWKVVDAEVGFNYPPMHPNCRSDTLLVFVEEADSEGKKIWEKDEWQGHMDAVREEKRKKIEQRKAEREAKKEKKEEVQEQYEKDLKAFNDMGIKHKVAYGLGWDVEVLEKAMSNKEILKGDIPHTVSSNTFYEIRSKYRTMGLTPMNEEEKYQSIHLDNLIKNSEYRDKMYKVKFIEGDSYMHIEEGQKKPETFEEYADVLADNTEQVDMVNVVLRKGAMNEDRFKGLDADLEALDKVFEGSENLTDTTYYRGVKFTKEKDFTPDQFEVGREFVDKGFVFVSGDKSFADGYAQSMVGSEQAGILIIEAPAHSRIALGNAVGGHERERIIDRNSRFVVLEKKKVGDAWEIRTRLLQDEKEIAESKETEVNKRSKVKEYEPIILGRKKPIEVKLQQHQREFMESEGVKIIDEGRKGRIGGTYNPQTNVIYVRNRLNQDQMVGSFHHEYGHFLDYMKVAKDDASKVRSTLGNKLSEQGDFAKIFWRPKKEGEKDTRTTFRTVDNGKVTRWEYNDDTKAIAYRKMRIDAKDWNFNEEQLQDYYAGRKVEFEYRGKKSWAEASYKHRSYIFRKEEIFAEGWGWYQANPKEMKQEAPNFFDYFQKQDKFIKENYG